jgi:hypothetical protein
MEIEGKGRGFTGYPLDYGRVYFIFLPLDPNCPDIPMIFPVSQVYTYITLW